MSLARSRRPEDGAAPRNPLLFNAAAGLALAASPIFAGMALLTGFRGGGSVDMLCSAGHGSPLSGMILMYVLMSVFHLGPWLRLFSSPRSAALRA